MLEKKLIPFLHKRVIDFASQTNGLEIEFTEDEKYAEWTIKYNIIKLQFVLTKKDKILCPIATLFCRIYLGKNDVCFYHPHELMEYLEPDNFQCYYFPYIESEERMENCFSVLADFLKKHMARFQEYAKDNEMYDTIQQSKYADVIEHLTKTEFEPEFEEVAMNDYEKYILLPHFVGEGPYRQFICGNYANAIKEFEKMLAKSDLTSYEKRLLTFIKELEQQYTAVPEECNNISKVKKIDAPSSEGLSILLAAIACEVVLGLLFSGIVALIGAILSTDTVYYAAMPWYDGFLFAGTAAVFGGIASRNVVRKIINKDSYQEIVTFEKLINPAWVEPFTRAVFVAALVIMLVTCVCTSFMSSCFYEDHVVYNEGEEFFPTDFKTSYYKDLKEVYYSEGLYNDFDDFIDRPSYLLVFSDGQIWDSDAFVTVEEFEEHILPMMEGRYEEIKHIKARNVLWE